MNIRILKTRLRIYFLLNWVTSRLRDYGVIKQIESVSETFYEDCASGKISIHGLWSHADSNNIEIQLAVATAPNCPLDLIEYILQTADSYLKYKILESRKNCDSDFLRFVYQSSLPDDSAVRTLIMIHPLCPMDIRTEIMTDPHCQPFIGEIPNLQEYYIRKFFNANYHTKKTMCTLQRIPDDLIEDVLKSKDETLIASLHHNEKLRDCFSIK